MFFWRRKKEKAEEEKKDNIISDEGLSFADDEEPSSTDGIDGYDLPVHNCSVDNEDEDNGVSFGSAEDDDLTEDDGLTEDDILPEYDAGDENDTAGSSDDEGGYLESSENDDVYSDPGNESEEDIEDIEGSEKTEGVEEPEATEKPEAAEETDAAEEIEDTEYTEAETAYIPEPVKEKKGFFARLFEGLTKTRNSIVGGLDSIFSAFSAIDDDFYDELEEVMITSDMGVRTTDSILEKLRERVKSEHIHEPEACREILIDSIREQMDVGSNAYDYENRTSVLLVVGVNGVGKTTSIGKLASQMKTRGKKVLLAAADTFRAGAVEQLAEWSRRAGVDLIASGEGADPAAVVFDAVSAAKARKTDILIVDTAGRLHNKKNLMEELRKISRVIDREFPDAYRETLAVVDATTGQNALSQAREFMEVSDVSGIILTKMDGTAKGGIAVAIQSELHLPVKYIGIGEQIEDLQKFNADQYVRALFGKE